MKSIKSVLFVSLLMVAPITVVSAQEASFAIPQSIRLQHDQIVSRLSSYSKHENPVGATASKASAAVNAHYAKEEAFVLPPLGLLPRIANGDISMDMEPAIAMASRTRAAMPELQDEHIRITSLMNELIEAGTKTHDDELVRLATRVAAQSLNHIEVLMPTTIMIGDYLRQRLSTATHSK